MGRIVVYIAVILILFSGINHIKQIWQENEQSLDATYDEVKGGFWSWFETAKETTQELKEKLNSKVKEASDKYESLKQDLETMTNTVNEKKEQLEQTLKEMEEAKKALDELLAKEQEGSSTEPASN